MPMDRHTFMALEIRWRVKMFIVYWAQCGQEACFLWSFVRIVNFYIIVRLIYPIHPLYSPEMSIATLLIFMEKGSRCSGKSSQRAQCNALSILPSSIFGGVTLTAADPTEILLSFHNLWSLSLSFIPRCSQDQIGHGGHADLRPRCHLQLFSQKLP